MSENGRSMASEAMDEAIELAIEGDSPYPAQASFIDADAPYAGKEIVRAGDRGKTVVLVAEDGTSRVLEPGRKIEPQRSAPEEAAVRNPTG
jgi:hypothetical protein